MAGIASAKTHHGGWCATHKNAKKCHSSGGTGGTPPPNITVQIDPNPLTETGQSLVVATIQVETSPSFSGDAVNIDSSQLSGSCMGGVAYVNLQNGSTAASPHITTNGNIQAILDNDGNATVVVAGLDCAPGTSVVEASLIVAPFYTALGNFVVNPPNVTPPGVTGYPQTSGKITTGEVETGDTTASGDSDVYAVFMVETDPVYAEQQVEIGSAQLEARCHTGWSWSASTGIGTGVNTISGTGPNTGPKIQATIDNDGNAVFLFLGTSCAAGSSSVIADVLAGTHPTYTTNFNIVAPTPTI